MDDDQQFCLRWNNHQSTLVAVFDTLLEKGMHVDCTLAAEGQTLKAHKVVLSACSPYFESVLSQQYDKHPIIILKDVKYAELRAMMDYMYRGEVNISQDQLAALLKAAESLQIKGLSDNKPSRPPSRPAHATPAAPAPAAAAHPAHPPRAPSPPPQVRDGSIDSREGSVSPTRRRKKARRMSEGNVDGAHSNGCSRDSPHCKEEAPRDGVEDLTLDDEPEDPPQPHNDVVRNFQWHMERSQDEIMNSSDNVRDSQEACKEGRLPPSALLSLLSMQHARSAQLALAMPMPMPMPAPIEAHLLQQAFNNNASAPPTPPTPPPALDYKREAKRERDDDSDNEYDDTDDIVLPDEADADGYYALGGGGAAGAVRRRGDGGSSGDDATRQFECRHCGKKYRWKSTLRRHENVECGGKAPAHQCPYCAYRAKQRGNLGVHIRKHHHDEWYLYASNKVRRNRKTSV